jgi:hypothetical protein
LLKRKHGHMLQPGANGVAPKCKELKIWII